jgi:hypothetical protein
MLPYLRCCCTVYTVTRTLVRYTVCRLVDFHGKPLLYSMESHYCIPWKATIVFHGNPLSVGCDRAFLSSHNILNKE